MGRRYGLAAIASHLLEQDVMAWIADRRASGASLRQIVEDLDVATKGIVRVHPETIRRWILADTHGEEHVA